MQVASTRRELRRHVRPVLTRRRRVAICAVSAVSALLLSGCAGGGASTSSHAVRGVSSAPGTAEGFASSSAAKPAVGTPQEQSDVSRTSASKPGTPVVGAGSKLTRSASLDLQVKNISTAAARVRGIAIGLQALVMSEQIGKSSPGGQGPVQDSSAPDGGFGTMTLSVPADKLDTAMDQLAASIGTVRQRTTSSQDVTSQYVDTQSRLKTMRASVERVRTLMARAKDLGQVVALESEMSRREADLESLESQLDALKTSVERSTLAVSLSTPGSEPVATAGFLAGLRSGWDAFTGSASALFTAVGALLPFGVLFALLGVPLRTWWRRRRQVAPSVVNP